MFALLQKLDSKKPKIVVTPTAGVPLSSPFVPDYSIVHEHPQPVIYSGPPIVIPPLILEP